MLAPLEAFGLRYHHHHPPPPCVFPGLDESRRWASIKPRLVRRYSFTGNAFSRLNKKFQSPSATLRVKIYARAKYEVDHSITSRSV